MHLRTQKLHYQLWLRSGWSVFLIFKVISQIHSFWIHAGISTLTNQIATGLRNIELLESTQLTLQETAALYSASRSISQAQVEDDVVKK